MTTNNTPRLHNSNFSVGPYNGINQNIGAYSPNSGQAANPQRKKKIIYEAQV
jgi:hypothetical protein